MYEYVARRRLAVSSTRVMLLGLLVPSRLDRHVVTERRANNYQPTLCKIPGHGMEASNFAQSVFFCSIDKCTAAKLINSADITDNMLKS